MSPEDVPAYAIVVGIPARIIRYRFPEDVRRRREQSRWWTADEQVERQCRQNGEDLIGFLALRNVSIPDAAGHLLRPFYGRSV